MTSRAGVSSLGEQLKRSWNLVRARGMTFQTFCINCLLARGKKSKKIIACRSSPNISKHDDTHASALVKKVNAYELQSSTNAKLSHHNFLSSWVDLNIFLLIRAENGLHYDIWIICVAVRSEQGHYTKRSSFIFPPQKILYTSGFCFCCCQLSAHYDLHTVENEAQMTSKVPFFPAPLDSAKVQFLGVGVKCSPAECISENRKIFPNDSIVVFR